MKDMLVTWLKLGSPVKKRRVCVSDGAPKKKMLTVAL